MTHHREHASESARAREARALSHARVLGDLFERRPDLAGVYSPADLAAESVRWSA
jgi:hypothetical protein